MCGLVRGGGKVLGSGSGRSERTLTDCLKGRSRAAARERLRMGGFGHQETSWQRNFVQRERPVTDPGPVGCACSDSEKSSAKADREAAFHERPLSGEH